MGSWRPAVNLVETKLGHGSRILDFGCGAGPIITRLKQKGYDCIGIDCSYDMLRYTRQRLLERGFDDHVLLRGDCGRAPFQDNSSDCVICLGVISYLKDYRPVLSEIMRILTPAGLAIVSFRNKFRPVFSDPVLAGEYLIKRGIGRRNEEPERSGRFLDPDTVRSNIVDAGFNVADVEEIGFGRSTSAASGSSPEK